MAWGETRIGAVAVGWAAAATIAAGQGISINDAAHRVAAGADHARRAVPVPVAFDKMRHLHVTTLGRVVDGPVSTDPVGRACNDQSTHTDADFDSGSFLAQAGFAQGEMAVASYQLSPSDFPIRIDSVEMVFATVSAIEQTTTFWSVLVWDGDPNTGTLVAEFSSDDVILPHLVAGPGTTGTNLQISVDPSDPQQIFVFNNSGTARFSVGFRIDRHNAPSANPCLVPPDQNRNAFPVTDTGPLDVPGGNWLFGLNCGPFGCPPGGGWTTFAGLNPLCRPSGDWVLRASWTRVDCQPGVGACCKPDGSCEVMLVGDCDAIGGTFQGDGTACDDPGLNCPAPVGACCNPSGGCLGDLTQSQCAAFGGSWAGPGTDCRDTDGDGIADDCEPQCLADLTGASGDGTPDGVVDASDFFFYLGLFADADPGADLTGPGSNGVPDGLVDADDFFFYLGLFADGCP